MFASATVSHIEPVHTPCAPKAERGRHLPAGRDPARGEHRHVGADGVDDLGYEHHRRDVAAVPAGFGALRDEHVDADRDLTFRVRLGADERADQEAVLVGKIDDVGRGRPERVDEHLHAGMLE